MSPDFRVSSVPGHTAWRMDEGYWAEIQLVRTVLVTWRTQEASDRNG